MNSKPSGTELVITLPGNFDATRDGPRLLARIDKEYGAGTFQLRSIDLKEHKAYAVRVNALTTVDDNLVEGTKTVNLAEGVKVADGAKVASALEETYPGFTLIRFDPYRRKAILGQLDKKLLTAREALANALNVKPWDVQVGHREDGGYHINLPPNYMPSKHDKALNEVATIMVGKPGWYVTIDTTEATAQIIPATLPTFPRAFPTPLRTSLKPFDNQDKNSYRISVGRTLPATGDQEPEETVIDFLDGPGTQVGGLAGSGKSVFLNAAIYNFLSASGQLAIIDIPQKAVDFDWCKPFVIKNGWGCDGDQESAAVMNAIYEEGARRAKILKQHGAQNITRLPREAAFPPLLVVVDELTGLMALEKVPKTSKNSPQKLLNMAAAAEETNFYKELLYNRMQKTAAEYRFAGIYMLVATQVASVSTGIGPAFRTNLPNKFLLGANPTEGNRKLILADPSRVPTVPDHVRNDPQAAIGVGVYEPGVGAAGVFKPYFASVSDYHDSLIRLGVPTTDYPGPSVAQMEAVSINDDEDDSYDDWHQQNEQRRKNMGDPAANLTADLDPDLKGAARAAAASKMLADRAKAG